MHIFNTIGLIFLALALLLIAGTLFFSTLKTLKKRRFHNWTFLDYISVGYLDYLFRRYIKREKFD